MTNRARCRRRRFLGVVGTGVTLGMAGCSGSEDPAAEAATDSSEDETATFYEHPGEGPREFPDEYTCDSVCGMTVTDWPDWNAQVAHESGYGAFFCSTGCLAAYMVDPTDERFDDPAGDITGTWVTDYATGELIDAAEASFVLTRDEDRIDEPMGVNPQPFADRADAEALVAEVDALTTDDIVGLDEFDYDVAAIYRGRRLPPRPE